MIFGSSHQLQKDVKVGPPLAKPSGSAHDIDEQNTKKAESDLNARNKTFILKFEVIIQ